MLSALPKVLMIRALGALLLLFGSIPVATAAAATDESSMTISAQALDDHSCDSSEWHFVINGLEDAAEAPASIHVTWSDGGAADIALDSVTGGAAHYRSTDHLDATVTGATATIDAGWSGQFVLSHGPCESGGSESGGGGGENAVTAAAPTVQQACDQHGAVITIHATDHVSYELNGAATTAGEHLVTADSHGDYTAMVTAHADAGYTLTGQDSWDLSGTLDCQVKGGGDTTTVQAKALTDHACDSSEWGFAITGLDSETVAPASITVTWSGGITAIVALSEVTGSTAHYRTTEHLDLAVTSATATLPADWSGEFNLSHGPCDHAGQQPTTLTAPAPGATENCEQGGLMVTIPAADHIRYSLNGQVVTAGQHLVSAGQDGQYSATVTASAQNGYTLAGTTTFTFTGTLTCPSPGTTGGGSGNGGGSTAGVGDTGAGAPPASVVPRSGVSVLGTQAHAGAGVAGLAFTGQSLPLGLTLAIGLGLILTGTLLFSRPRQVLSGLTSVSRGRHRRHR